MGVSRVSLVAGSLASICACVRHLPPAPQPAPVLPPVAAPATPPPEGHSRLIVDVVDGPAPVMRSFLETSPVDAGGGRTKFNFTTRLETACPAAPCVIDLPRGNVVLGFPYLNDPTTFETHLLHIGSEPAAFRKALSFAAPASTGAKVFGILFTTFGGISAVTGATLLPIGLAKDSDGMVTAGTITLGAGAIMLALGIVTLRRNPSVYRDGAATHFQLQQ
jgi:hypothetical protein